MEEYRQKRNFKLTPEPSPAKRRGKGELTFVIQKHSARSLHYDLRLEAGGVLKSWAVPHGPSLDPKEKHLAVMVEDHPLDYAGFEGVIPKGEYGAGEVIIWDRGTYVPVKGGEPFSGNRSEAENILQDGINKGKIIIFFNGQKLKGEFTLVKMNRGQNNWLLMKHADKFADSSRDILQENASVKSGLTNEDLKAGKTKADPPSSSQQPEKLNGAIKTGFPAKIPPMLATLADAPFSDAEWLFEPKLDGYRTLAFINNGKVKLHSRRGLDVTDKYSPLVETLERQKAAEMVLDGEIIALDKDGKNCFQCLQNYLKALDEAKMRRQPVRVPLIYYVFDILYLNGYDLTEVPLIERKLQLENSLATSSNIRLVEHFTGDGNIVFKAALDNGLEGIIAKRKNSIYESGKRSHYWLKIKGVLTDEFVIGGYSKGQGARSHAFGALLLGQYDSKGKLVYSGHVGTGFDDEMLSELLQKLKPLQNSKCPFTDDPPLNAPTTWVKPKLVAEVKFSQRTEEGLLRAPVFLRLRDDKPTAEVERVETVSLTDPPASNPPATSGQKILHHSKTITGILNQLDNGNKKFDLDVEGHRVEVNKLDKELWPEYEKQRALTKRDLLVYLTLISQYILPHLKDRPITLSRYPDGINGEQFFQKHWVKPPDFVTIIPITTEHEGTKEYMVCNNLATLLWLGQSADLELHTWFSRISSKPDRPAASGSTTPDEMVRYPDFIIFDIDPYLYSGKEKGGAEPELNRKAFKATTQAALWLKDILDGLKLAAFVKTSGKTGLHVYVPVKRQFTYDEVRSAARTICLYVNQKHPKETTLEWAVEKRKGKIFLDYNQNTFGKTLASIYSPRPVPQASVSMPLNWSELGKVYPSDFTIFNVPDKLTEKGDLWADIMESKKDLKDLLNSKK